MNKSQKIRLVIGGCLVLLLIILGIFGINYISSPEFPSSVPSSDRIDAGDENLQEQLRFYNKFTQYLRDNHGGLVSSGEMDKRPESTDETEEGVLYFLHKYRSINDELMIKLIRKFIRAEQVHHQLKRYSYKNKALEKPDAYRVVFLKNDLPWVSVKLEWEDENLYRAKTDLQYTEMTEAIQTDHEEPVSKPSERVQLVIIIDDLGYNMDVFEDLISLDYEITYSILPRLPFSMETAERVNKAGHNVMLHLPMQPKDWPRFNPGIGALLIADNEEMIQQKMDLNLQSVPYIIGVNNHMGSAYTQYAEGLDVLMKILEGHNLFFLDSKTAPGQTAKMSAKRNGVRYISRNIFLDNIQEKRYVKNQLQKAANLAKKWGKAIAIGHPYSVTYQVLAEQLPILRDQGIHIAKVSDII